MGIRKNESTTLGSGAVSDSLYGRAIAHYDEANNIVIRVVFYMSKDLRDEGADTVESKRTCVILPTIPDTENGGQMANPDYAYFTEEEMSKQGVTLKKQVYKYLRALPEYENWIDVLED